MRTEQRTELMGNKKILIIGIDRLGEWSKKPYLEVTGVVDLYNQRGKLPEEDAQWLGRYPVFPDVETALAQSSPDLATVVVPGYAKSTLHAERKVLEKGIDLVAQKLRLDSLKDVEELIQIGKASRGRFYIGEFYRYLASVRTMKKLIQENTIGNVEYVVWNCILPLIDDKRVPWMESYRHITFEDLAYHHFSALHYLLGFHPLSIYAQSYAPSWTKLSTRSIASLQAITREAYHLHYLTTWGSRTEQTDYLGDIRLEGDKGTIELKGGRITVIPDEGQKQHVILLPAEYDGFWGIFDHLRDGWLGKETPLDGLPYTLEQFEPVLRAIYGAVQSAEEGSTVS